MTDMDYIQNISFNVASPEKDMVEGEEVPQLPLRGGLAIPSGGSERGSKKSDASPRAGTPLDEKKTWYLGKYPTYKQRNKEYKELFNNNTNSKFIVDFACAYNKDILHQGRMYLSTQHCCFYSNIFGFENNLNIPWKKIVGVSKEKTAFFIPNAIHISSDTNQYFFTTFANRDATFAILHRLWEGILSGQPMSEEEVCQMIMCQYPEEEFGEGGQQLHQDVPDAEETEEPPQGREGDEEGNLEESIKAWTQDTPGTLILDRVVTKPLSQVYSMLYTNSNFYFNFQKDRGSTELDVGDWELTASGTSSREVAYNMKMNNPVGPKTCQVKEIQLKRAGSLDQQLYCIDTEAFNSGVPYADSFTVRTHVCAHKEDDNTTRLTVKAEIVFRKDLWNFLKTKIETNAWAGIRTYYQDLGEALEAHREDQPGVAHPLKRRLSQNINRLEAVVHDTEGEGAGTRSLFRGNIFLGLVIALLCLTCVLNIVVLVRLTSSPEGSPPLAAPTIPPALLEKLPETDQDWVLLLQAQAAKHHQIAQGISDSLKQVSAALSKSEKILENVGQMLRQELSQADLDTLIETIQKQKSSLKQEL